MAWTFFLTVIAQTSKKIYIALMVDFVLKNYCTNDGHKLKQI